MCEALQIAAGVYLFAWGGFSGPQSVITASG